MHELSITCSIVELVANTAKGRKVHRVTVEIGQLSGVMPDFDRALVPRGRQGNRSRERKPRHPRDCGDRALRGMWR